MLSPIEPGNTTQWQVMSWAFSQAQYLTATQHHVLLYLAGHAFYRTDNPEKGEVGQVMRQASYVGRISSGTSLKKDAIRKALVALQMAGYIQREARKDPGTYGQQPHRIFVLWEFEGLREGLRNESVRLPQELLAVPTRPVKRSAEAPVLTLLQGYDENAH